MANKEVVDVELLQQYIDMLGIEMLVEMLSLYQKSMVQYLADIEQALTHICEQTWYESCHKLKGATSSMGFVELTTFLTEIQHKPLSERIEQGYMDHIVNMNNQAIEYLMTWLKSK